MSILAYGSEQVEKLQTALGGTLPADAGEAPRMQLDTFVGERFKATDAMRQATERLTAATRDRVFSHIPQNDLGIKQSVDEARRFYQDRLEHRIRQPALTKVEPRYVTGSGFWLKPPPYDVPWTNTNNGGQASADNAAGTYSVATQSIASGSVEAAAGLAVWFFCTATDPMQRVAALLDYEDDWWDSAMGYVAHNDLRTRIWVWGNTENAWLTQSDLSPSWSDGVGWFESHGNDPSGDAGRMAIETFFPAEANNWYLAWVWSDASVFANGGLFGIAASSIQFSVTVPFVVFGSLF